ncbi:restriction endonuclease subunit S [Paenarthrobacter aurescens]|uniref:Restriction modification system S chain-like protein n=1 Tax=Paenarthrobacter aurescens TaxID=43663 RepID=A0A4Y3NPJ3_PAEAU|nr:restriction endonuclease subunit S [Paenarthrobacter aurescens]MDO6145208.1 restriction endonuclease subunit S [Paenarthrobacter aurescens]MDO6149053.1 restriction endonuclease subunit S [Paenarthrobacter aurescens]MDO6160299.1 restriction endonuclease subunit S [Paenarthrobacter aurescens]MDO6164158.1 restriction endonuclease subunit S [Paenarthrobacter aurescens]GEB20861.1 restriction modification system S chain-like protein [Paenarthrobacter aurescens]
MKAAKLADVCDIIIGRTPSRSEPRFWAGDLPWLSIADMNQGRNLLRTKERVTSDAMQECKLRIVEAGTVLMSFKLSIGKVGIARTRMATNEAIAALPVKDSSRLDSTYLSRVLESMDHTGAANRAAMGGTLNKASLAAIRIPIPPLEEQRRIAAVLDKADELRAKRRRAIAHLDALIQSIFHSMFGDPSKAEDGQRLEELLASIDSGTSPVSEDRPATPDEWGILKVSAVTSQTYIDSENKALISSKPKTANEVCPGDVLFTRKNTPKLVAAVAIVRRTRPRLLIPDLVFRLNIRDRTQLDPEYLQSVMAYPTQRASVQRLAGGSAASMSNISKSKLATVKIPVPPLELQQTFATRVAAVERLKETHRKHLAELDALFASLQNRAFKGEL